MDEIIEELELLKDDIDARRVNEYHAVEILNHVIDKLSMYADPTCVD